MRLQYLSLPILIPIAALCWKGSKSLRRFFRHTEGVHFVQHFEGILHDIFYIISVNAQFSKSFLITMTPIVIGINVERFNSVATGDMLRKQKDGHGLDYRRVFVGSLFVMMSLYCLVYDLRQLPGLGDEAAYGTVVGLNKAFFLVGGVETVIHSAVEDLRVSGEFL